MQSSIQPLAPLLKAVHACNVYGVTWQAKNVQLYSLPAHPVLQNLLASTGLQAYPESCCLAVDSQAGVSGSPADVDKLFSIAKQNGLNSIRFFPFGILGNFKLINSPGKDLKAA